MINIKKNKKKSGSRKTSHNRYGSNKIKHRRRIHFEALEPRILLSADIGIQPPDVQDTFEPVLPELHSTFTELDTQVSDERAADNPETAAPETVQSDEAVPTAERTEPVEGAETGTTSQADQRDETVQATQTDQTAETANTQIAAAFANRIHQQFTREIIIIDSAVPDHASLVDSILENIKSAISEDDDSTSGDNGNSGDEEIQAVEKEQGGRDQQYDSDAVTPYPGTLSFSDNALLPTNQRGSSPDDMVNTIFILDPDRDGIEQISGILEKARGLTAVHILSHGTAGQMRLGNTQVDKEKLKKYMDKLKGWSNALTEEGDILLYGCRVADGETGIQFVESLASYTEADVAASTNDTGSDDLGGDWLLEYSTGVIESAVLYSSSTGDYNYLLEDITGTDGIDTLISNPGVNDTLTGKKGNDTYKFQNNWGADPVGLDTVIENIGEGTDTLDFSMVSDSLTFTISGADGSVTVEDVNGNSVTAANIENFIGGSGDNDFIFSPGAIFTGSITGNGNDTLTFTPSIDPNDLLTFSGSSITSPNLNITHSGIDNIDVNFDKVDITDSATKLSEGLSDLVDWAAKLQDHDKLGDALAGLGANVGVTLGNSLDIEEAFDQLRLEIQKFINDKQEAGSNILAQEIQDLIDGFNQTNIQYADRSIIGDVFDPTVTDSDSFIFTLEFKEGDVTTTSSIAVAGNPDLATFLNNINDQLNADENLRGKLTAVEVIQGVGIDEKSRIAFQITSPDVDEFVLMSDTVGQDKLGFLSSDSIAALGNELQDIGDLNVSTTGISVELTLVSGVPELVFNFNYTAGRTTDFNIDLGKGAEDHGLTFDASATINATSTLNAGLGLGLKLNDTADDFFFNLDSLTLDVQAGAPDINSSARIGFLAATVSGNAQLNAAIGTSTLSHESPNDGTLPTAVNVVTKDFDLDLSVNVNVNDDMDEGLKDGLDAFNKAAGDPDELKIELTDGDPFEGRDLDIGYNNFDDLGKFNEFNAATFISQVGTVRDWFGSVTESDIFNSIDIPFVTPALNGIIDLADAVGDTLLYDDGDDGEDDDTTIVVDIREALSKANLEDKIRIEGDGSKLTFIAIDSSISNISISDANAFGFDGTESFDNDKLVATTGASAVLAKDISFKLDLVENGKPKQYNVTVTADTTTNNETIGNDHAKLLDENNAATFETTQDLANKLFEIIGIDENVEAAYDKDSKRLTFELTFNPVDFKLEVPVDFNFDLSPIGNIGTVGSPEITLGAGIDISLTLGLDLSDTPAGGGKDLETGTKLIDLNSIDDLADAIKTDFSLSPDNVPSAELGNADQVDISFINTGAEMTGSPILNFNHFDAAADTIVRTDGESWLDDGFRVNQQISVTGTNSNNGTYTIFDVTHSEISLVASNELQEEDKSGVKITGPAATMTESPDLNFSNVGTITRSEGSWSDDGFKSGDYIVVEGASVNNGVYQINDIVSKTLLLYDSTGTQTDASFTSKTDVANVTITVPDRIKLNSSGNWAAENFKSGQLVAVSGTQSNNRTFLIADIIENDSVMILSSSSKTLDENLRNDTDLKITGKQIIRLSSDATFSIDGVVVQVLAQPMGENSFVSATSDNNNLLDLVSDINSALDEAGIKNIYQAKLSNGNIQLTDISEQGGNAFVLTNVNDVARDELGFSNGQTADSADLLITLSDGSQARIDLDGAETVQHVIDKIQNQTQVQTGNQVKVEIDPDTNAGLRLLQVPALTGNPRLSFKAADNTIVREDDKLWSADQFAIDQTIRVSGADKDNDGEYQIVSIGMFEGKSALKLSGSMDKDQSSIKDVRITLTGDEIFRVEALNGSKIAGKLGILKADVSTDVDDNGKVEANDGDGIIIGDAIAGASILDRFFIQDPTVEGNVFIKAGDASKDGITVTGDFGFVSVDLNGYGAFDTTLTLGLDDPTPNVKGITINELIKSLSHISSIVSWPTIGGDKVDGESLKFSGKTIVRTNNNAWDDFSDGEYISIIGAAERNNGHFKITEVNGSILTLDLDEDFTAETISSATVLNEIGSFQFNVDVKPDFGLINEEEASKVVVALFDFGNPFADTDFKKDQFTLGSDNKSFTLGGDWTDRIKRGADIVAELDVTEFASVTYDSENSFLLVGDQSNTFELGAKVTAILATETVTSKIKTINYDESKDQTTFTIQDTVLTADLSSVSIASKDAETKVVSVSYDENSKETTVTVVDEVLTDGVNSLTVDTPRSLDYLMKLPDLGDLVKFDEIGISQIIDGLIELSDFLGQFEAFGFLSEPIPIIDVSVNDVLAFADKFDAAVQEAKNNPAGTLQVLENKLKEALGIPSGIDSDALGFTERQSSDDGILNGNEEVGDVSELTHDMIFLLSLNNGPSQLIKVSHKKYDDTAKAYTEDQIETIAELVANTNRALKSAFGVVDIGTDNDFDNNKVQTTEASGVIAIKSNETDGSGNSQSLAISNPIDMSIFEDDKGTAETDDDISMFRMDFGLGIGFTKALDVGFDLGGDTGIMSGAAGLEASGAIDFNLGLGIDLNNPTNIYMFDSDVTGQLQAIGDDLAFRAGIGPLGVFINEGSARVGGGISEGDSKLFTFGLDFDPDSDNEAYKLINDIELANDFTAELIGKIEVDLPVYFPAETLHKGAVVWEAGLSVDNNLDFNIDSELYAKKPDGTTSADFTIADLFTFDLNELSLMDNMLLAVDGIDSFLEGLQDVLDGELFGLPLPLIGDKLSDGARFIEDFRDDFVDPFRDEIENMADQDENIVSRLLFELLGPDGIGLLMDHYEDLDGDGKDDDNGEILANDIILDTNVNDSDVELEENYMQWNMNLGQVLELGTGIGFDLGIPGLGLETQGDINLELGWNLDFGFGISFEEAFYLDISDDSELEVELNVTLPDFGLTGQLAFLQLDAEGNKNEFGNDLTHFTAKFGVDVVNKKDEGKENDPGFEKDKRLAFSELGSIGLDAGIAGEAVADLHFELKLNSDLAPGVAGVFPKIVTDFLLDWSLDDDEDADGLQLVSFDDPKISGNLVKDGLNIVEFRDVSLDLGSFISDFIDPILGTVREVTEPLQPIVDFITTPLPVISDIGPEMTVLDLAELTGKVNTGLIESIADLITFINAIPLDAETVMLNFGDFTIYDKDENLGLDITDPNADVQNDVMLPTEDPNYVKPDPPPGKTGTKGFVNKLKDAGDFDFPIINDPTQIFNLLLGKEAVLMTYDLKPLVAEFSYKQSFPVYGPLFVAIKGEIGVAADFAFGFDTAGITQFADSGFRNPLLIFNGFYISDTDIPTGEFGTDVPELTVSGFLGVAAELNLGIASAGAGGGVGLNVYFNLFDPNHDGKVRVPEIVNSIINEFRYGSPVFAPLALFDVSGDIYAQLFAYIEFLFFEIEFDITPPITIVEFDIPFTRVPTLAEDIGDGVLQLNMGDFAAQRLNYNTTDGDETFIITGSGKTVNVQLGGTDFIQTYHNVEKILALAGEGNDTIDLSGLTSTSIEFELEGGVGNDTIILSNNATGAAVINGGVGDDVIEGGGGNDQIYGGAGNDTIKGNGGNDTIFGDEGEIAYVETTDEDDNIVIVTDSQGNNVIDYTRARVKVTDGDDVIDGGANDDTIFGGGGEDDIQGGANNDLIMGDGGILRNQLIITAQNEVNKDKLPEPDFELSGNAALEFIIDGEDFMITVLAEDTNEDTTLDNLVTLINEQLAGEDGIDGRITAEAAEDEKSIQFRAAAGVIEFRVKGANDTAVKELGFTRFFKKVAVLDDINRGDGRADTLSGGTGDDTIYGGRGNDTINGNENNDKLFGGDGFDLIYGNSGNDRIFGGEDNDELSGGADDDHMEGGGGHDWIWGDWMVDEQVSGDAGIDSIWGGIGSDTIFGGEKGDFLFGDSDPDTIFGEEGNDTIDGGHGADKAFGGDDNDEITSSQGDDFIDGQSGSDDFIINTMGGDMSSLLTVFDSGSVFSGTDTLIVNGTEDADRFLLRSASADVFDATLTDLNSELENVESRLAAMGINKALQLDLATQPPRSFVAKLNNDDNFERINYYDNLESIIVNTLEEADHVVSDNTSAEVTINGGDGNDIFQVGQIFNSPRDTDAGIDQYDVFDTVQTTKGFLSNGINAPMTINGEDGADYFVVFRNLKVLTLNGGDGDDEFLVKAFALEGSVDDPDRDLTDITGAGGADLIQYAVNAPVGINGGDGLDTVIVLGTEFGDDFVMTAQGVFGGGLNVNFVNIEVLKLDAAEGNDRIFVLGTGSEHITEIFAGEGSDAFFIAGDTPPIVSQDLLGHSGIIAHNAQSSDERFNDINVDGISANVGDDDEPFIRIIKDDGNLQVTEDGALIATYSLVLTRQPRGRVGITAIAPRPSPDEKKQGIEYFTVMDTGNDITIPVTDTFSSTSEARSLVLLTFTPKDNSAISLVKIGGIETDDYSLEDNKLTILDTNGKPLMVTDEVTVIYNYIKPGGTNQIIFDESNWFIPQAFEVTATHDLAYEGTHIGTVNHIVTEFPVLGAPNYEKMAIPSVNIEIIDNDLPGLVIEQTDGTTRVIEGADFGDDAPFAGEYTIRLNQKPDTVIKPDGTIVPTHVNVTLINEDGQLQFEQTEFTFTSDGDDWKTPRTVRVIGNDDAANEGFHYGYIKHIVTSDQADVPVENYSQSFDSTSEAEKRSAVILDYQPINKDAITKVELVDGDGKISELDADRYSIDFNQLTILDENGQPLKVTDQINVTYDYIKPGFQNVAVETVGVEIGDNDAPGVFVLQSGGSTNVIESDITIEEGILLTDKATSAESDSITGSQPISEEFIGLDIVITEGAGAGQVRTITVIDGALARIDSPWETLPDDTSQYNIINRMIIKPVNDDYQVVLTAQPDADVVINVTPQPTKTSGRPPFQFSAVAGNVAVTELGFTESSDPTISLTSGKPAPDNGRLGGDLVFSIDLTPDGQGNDAITVTLAQDDMADNQSINDLIDDINLALQDAGLLDIDEFNEIMDGVQLSDHKSKIAAIKDEQRIVLFKVVEPQHKQVEVSTTTLTFTPDKWNIPQTVFVNAINDDVVDGGEVKAFAPVEKTVARIQGPLIINGAGGQGSDAGLGADPFRLPGETNDVGNVVKVPADSQGNLITDQIVLDGNDIDKLGPTFFKSLDTFEPGDESNDEKAKVIINITSGPGEGQERVIVARNSNTFILAESWDIAALPTSESRYIFIRQLAKVNEAEQVDVATVFHNESLADNTGTVTATRLYGLGMGPDIELDGLMWPGGLTYTALENLTVHMGKGDDRLNVFGAQNRDDFQTVTVINTGAGDDEVMVDIEAESEPVAIGTVTDSRSRHLIDNTADFPTDGRGLSGYVLQVTYADGNVQKRTILFNDATTLYVDEPWITLPQAAYVDDTGENGENDYAGDTYKIIKRPAGLISINTEAGNDTLDASPSTAPVIAFGELGEDLLIGGQGDDILIGDLGQIDYVDQNGNIVTRFGTGEIPFRQTDGVFRDPKSIMTVNPDKGDNDTIHAGDGDNTVFGGQGSDVITTGDNGMNLVGADNGRADFDDDGNPLLFEDQTFGGDDVLTGGAGRDFFIGGPGADRLIGGSGDDILIGDDGLMIFQNGQPLTAETTNLFSGGNDFLDGGPGNDVMLGAFGSDTFIGDFSEDIMIGEYARITYDNEKVEFVVRLGQYSLDLIANRLYDLYASPFTSNPLILQAHAIGGILPAGQAPIELIGTLHTIAKAAMPPISHGGDHLRPIPPEPSIEEPPVMPEPPMEEPPIALEEYRVREGDSLWNIAGEKLGDPFKWREIIELNPEITDPDLIHPGQIIKIPAASTPGKMSPEGESGTKDEGMSDLVAVAAGFAGWSAYTPSREKKRSVLTRDAFKTLEQEENNRRYVRW